MLDRGDPPRSIKCLIYPNGSPLRIKFSGRMRMRVRAGIVLIQNDKVALIERHRAGLEYYVFPGGGVDEGETPEHAAVREAMEELGIDVAIQQKIAEIQ